MTSEHKSDTSEASEISWDSEGPQPVKAIEGDPKNWQYIVATWNALIETAHVSPGGWVWEGSLTKLVNESAGLGRYGQVVNRMVAMGCIEMMHRGGGRGSSVWALLQTPTRAAHRDTTGSGQTRRKTQTERVYEDRINALNGRINRIEPTVLRLEAQVKYLLKELEQNNDNGQAGSDSGDSEPVSEVQSAGEGGPLDQFGRS